MFDAENYGIEYVDRMLSLLNDSKYASLRFDNELLAAFQALMKSQLFPILGNALDGISPATIDTAMMRLQKEVVPQLEAIDFTHCSELMRRYYAKVTKNRRGIGLLFDYYDKFILLPIPFDESLHNAPFLLFGKNIQACWSTVPDDTEKLKEIFGSVQRVGQEYVKRQIALMQLSAQVDSFDGLQPPERLRVAAELVGKIVATCIEPIIAHMSEVIAIVIDKKAPKDFRARITFMQAHCPRAGIDLSILELDNLSFIRNAVAHAGVYFDYEDDRISLKNSSGENEEVRKYSSEEMERFALHSISIVREFGEYLKYVAFRYNLHRGERKQWVKNLLGNINMMSDSPNHD